MMKAMEDDIQRGMEGEREQELMITLTVGEVMTEGGDVAAVEVWIEREIGNVRRKGNERNQDVLVLSIRSTENLRLLEIRTLRQGHLGGKKRICTPIEGTGLHM